MTLADGITWQAAFWLDDAARGEEAAESLELACQALPGALSPAPPSHASCTCDCFVLCSMNEPDAVPCICRACSAAPVIPC